MAEKRLVYLADPMCSWCYGFSPVIAAIAERFEDRMPLQLVMGGLRASAQLISYELAMTLAVVAVVVLAQGPVESESLRRQ